MARSVRRSLDARSVRPAASRARARAPRGRLADGAQRLAPTARHPAADGAAAPRAGTAGAQGVTIQGATYSTPRSRASSRVLPPSRRSSSVQLDGERARRAGRPQKSGTPARRRRRRQKKKKQPDRRDVHHRRARSDGGIMKARFARSRHRAHTASSVGAVLLYAAALPGSCTSSPKRAEAASVSEERRCCRARAREAQREPRDRRGGRASEVSEVLSPREGDAVERGPGGARARARPARRTANVTLGSITPRSPSLGAGGATTMPVVVTATGSLPSDHAVPPAHDGPRRGAPAAQSARRVGSSRCRPSSSPSRVPRDSRTSTRRSRSNALRLRRADRPGDAPPTHRRRRRTRRPGRRRRGARRDTRGPRGPRAQAKDLRRRRRSLPRRSARHPAAEAPRWLVLTRGCRHNDRDQRAPGAGHTTSDRHCGRPTTPASSPTMVAATAKLASLTSSSRRTRSSSR